jgi:Flp pilus assembly protein TadD
MFRAICFIQLTSGQGVKPAIQTCLGAMRMNTKTGFTDGWHCTTDKRLLAQPGLKLDPALPGQFDRAPVFKDSRALHHRVGVDGSDRIHRIERRVAVATGSEAATIQRTRMSSRHKQRRRPQDGPTGDSIRPARSRGFRRLGWGLKLLAGLGVIALGICLAANFWRQSATGPAQSSPGSPGIRPNSSMQAPVAEAVGVGREKHKALIAEVNHGNELLKEGKVAEAVEVLTEVARGNPENEDVHYNLGLALARQGKTEDAIKEYKEALRIFPSYVEAHNNLGNALMRSGRIEEAIPHFEQSVKIMPDYAAAHNNLGTALQKVGRTEDAFAQFQQAVKFNPDYWEAHFNVATSWLQQGRPKEALTELETVLRLRPDFEPAKTLMARIQERKTGGADSKP